MENNPTDGAVTAPQTGFVPLEQMEIERKGTRSVPITRRLPRVIGGVCEYCGTLDPNVPSQYQYKLCGHYRGRQLACSYCPEGKNPDDVIYHHTLNVAAHPDNPRKMVVWCDSTTCADAHLKRFNLAGNTA